jgi:hypothetical protein
MTPTRRRRVRFRRRPGRPFPCATAPSLEGRIGGPLGFVLPRRGPAAPADRRAGPLPGGGSGSFSRGRATGLNSGIIGRLASKPPDPTQARLGRVRFRPRRVRRSRERDAGPDLRGAGFVCVGRLGLGFVSWRLGSLVDPADGGSGRRSYHRRGSMRGPDVRRRGADDEPGRRSASSRTTLPRDPASCSGPTLADLATPDVRSRRGSYASQEFVSRLGGRPRVDPRGPIGSEVTEVNEGSPMRLEGVDVVRLPLAARA